MLTGVRYFVLRLRGSWRPGAKRVLAEGQFRAKTQSPAKSPRCSGQIPDLMSPFLAMRMMWSDARYASAWIVHVGCPRPDVTKLLPSQMKRFETSCAR